MTDNGLRYAMARLGDAPNLDALDRVWDSLSDEYKSAKAAQECRARLRAEMQKAAAK